MKMEVISYQQRGIVQFFTLVFVLFIFFFSNTHSEITALQISSNTRIVEHLRLHVSCSDKEAWLDAEKASWEPWLAKQKGFLGRQLLWDPEKEQATLLISWASREEWKSISQDEIDAVQESFEAVARNATGSNLGNPFPMEFEGELIPQ